MIRIAFFVVAALATHPDPWPAFEARTHIALAGEDPLNVSPATLAAEWDAAFQDTGKVQSAVSQT